MKRTVIAALLALAFVCICCSGALTVAGMGRAWGTSAICSLGALTGRELSMLGPQIGWTAYAQSAPQRIADGGGSGRTAEAAVLSFLGAPDRIAFFPLVSGRLPVDGERGVCALDSDTAFRLFGSIHPGEARAVLGGEPLRVVGVMSAPRPLALVSAPQQGAYDRLVAADRDALAALTAALGIEADPFELSGPECARLARLMCAAPWALAAMLLLAAQRKRGGGWRIAATALLCALALGALLLALRSVPVRLLPARWSDLAFYGEQMAAWQSRPFRAPDIRDELLRSDMLRVALCNAAAIGALWMEKWWLRRDQPH